MLKDVLERIEGRLVAKKLSASGASKLAGLSSDAIRNMRRAVEGGDRQGVSTATIMALAPVLGTTGGWLLDGSNEDDERLVPIIGKVGADTEGTIFYATADETDELVPIPPGGDETAVALKVVGHSMGEWAPEGSLIYFETQKSQPTPDMIGYPCVVETEDGRVLLKRLLKGSRVNLYDLESRVGPTLENVRLRWAAEVTAVVPPRQARKIIRSASARQVA